MYGCRLTEILNLKIKRRRKRQANKFTTHDIKIRRDFVAKSIVVCLKGSQRQFKVCKLSFPGKKLSTDSVVIVKLSRFGGGCAPTNQPLPPLYHPCRRHQQALLLHIYIYIYSRWWGWSGEIELTPSPPTTTHSFFYSLYLLCLTNTRYSLFHIIL